MKRLKVWVNPSRSIQEEHAKKIFQALEEAELKHPQFAQPRGIPMHAAVFPITCDDCGETYWARDQYAAHAACGKGRGAAGFRVTP